MCLYGHHKWQSMDQPGKVANLARDQLNKGKYISLSPFAPENMDSREGFGRPVPRQPAYSPHSGWIWCLLMEFLPLSTVAPIYFSTNRHRSVPSLLGLASAYRWRSLPTVHRHRVSNPQGSSSNGRYLFRFHHGPINVHLSLPHPLLV